MPEYIKLADAQQCIKDYLKELIDEGKDNVEITEFNVEIQKRLAQVPTVDVLKETVKSIVFEIVNKPSQFKATQATVDFLNGIAHRQNEIIDIIKELVGETE